MGKSKYVFYLFQIFGIHLMMGQSVEINGQIIANSDVEGIHILNKTSKTFTISNSKGNFLIPVKLHDTLVFSGVLYEIKKVVVNQEMIHSKGLIVNLSEKLNVLDEVVVGKVLTGDLRSDLVNSAVKRKINFYDLGISGYTGKPKTQSERRLYEAGDFKPVQLLSLLGGSLPLNPILNAISGRTKELKNRVYLENQNECLNRIKSNFDEILFKEYPLDESYRNEFFYFCADDSQFDTLCAINDDFKMLEFLTEKLQSFKSNLQTKIQE